MEADKVAGTDEDREADKVVGRLEGTVLGSAEDTEAGREADKALGMAEGMAVDKVKDKAADMACIYPCP